MIHHARHVKHDQQPKEPLNMVCVGDSARITTKIHSEALHRLVLIFQGSQLALARLHLRLR